MELSDEARELYHRAHALASRVEIQHDGNGLFRREYTIGDVSFAIDGHHDYETGKIVETYLFVDTGSLVSDEVIEVVFAEEGYTGEEPIDIKANGVAIPQILKLVRQHMVLDDLSDV
jgi:hypothetical protein